MSLTNLDNETLYRITAAVKNAAARGAIPNFDDVVTICNELVGLLDQQDEFVKGLKCLKIIKELRNFVANI